MLALSGAIGSGKSLIPIEALEKIKNHKQALSTLGQPELMKILGMYFNCNDIILAQGLVQESNFATELDRENMRQTYEELLDLDDAIPDKHIVLVLNANDLVTHKGIDTDNDRIAGAAAKTFGAARAIFLTNKHGLLEEIHRDDSVVPEVRAGTGEWKRHVRSDHKSPNGSAGIESKCEVCDDLAMHGIIASIGYGKVRYPISNILNGDGTTFFPPNQ